MSHCLSHLRFSKETCYTIPCWGFQNKKKRKTSTHTIYNTFNYSKIPFFVFPDTRRIILYHSVYYVLRIKDFLFFKFCNKTIVPKLTD